MSSLNQINLKKEVLPCQRKEVRIKNFNEVALGYSEEQALKEAHRCLQCKKPPCIRGCPVEINIPKFISKIKEKDYKRAVSIIKEKNSLPGICGRVCPQEDQCEKVCLLRKKGESVAIGCLERFVADYEAKEKEIEIPSFLPSLKNIKVAVVGSGPAGLTVASELVKLGYRVTIFEALHKPGGVLMYGIPEFRLPKTIVEREINYIRKLGVELKLSIVIGKTKTIDDLFKEGYKAIFLGNGAGLPYFMNIPGENLNGVYSANEFLTRVNLMKAYLFPHYDTPIKIGRKVAVIGGGNVALDASRTALRLKAEKVYNIYRRSRAEMPAREEEIKNAYEEGVEFKFLTNPIRILGNENGWVKEIECIQMELGEKDDSLRRKPIPIKNSEFILEIDTVIIAIGQGANPLIASSTLDLETDTKGYFIVDPETGKTSRKGVFAGGDIVTGSATVISAMGAGKKVAIAINKYFTF